MCLEQAIRQTYLSQFVFGQNVRRRLRGVCKSKAKNVDKIGRVILQKPESRPTTKRLESLLKVTERAACSLGVSMTGRVFMMGDGYAYAKSDRGGEEG